MGLTLLLVDYDLNNPAAHGGGIVFGSQFVAASGWVHTLGLFGVKSWAGNFTGQMDFYPLLVFHWCLGATGFTGIKILNRKVSSDRNYYYLGFANHIHLGTDPYDEV